MAKRSFRALSAAVLLVVAACSSSSSKSATADSACTDLASAICGKIDSCVHINLLRSYGDLAGCTSRFKPTCTSSFPAKGSGATADNVEACAQGYSAATCADLIAGKAVTGCDVHGTLAAGAACANSVQCSGQNSYCNIFAGQTCGVCATLAAAGGTCQVDTDCESGLLCGFASTANTGACVAPGAAGAACDGPHPCGGGLACVNAVCSPRVGEGSACDPTVDNCDGTQALYCDQTSSLCKKVKTANAGEACGFLADGSLTLCTRSSTCQATAAQMGICLAAAADGATCDPSAGPGCLAPAVCVNGACTVVNPASCQ
jgi:Dickkopf N-terminal cysteine-rich region